MSCRKCVIAALATVAALGLAAMGVIYISITSGGSVARDRDPPHLEVAVAQWLLHRSVPVEIAAMKNPLSAAADGAEVAGGRTIFRKKCEICHGYDGGGKTDIGAGQYPRPPNLRDAGIQAMSDGEFFYHIRNGIRHTGMPACRDGACPTGTSGKSWRTCAIFPRSPHWMAMPPRLNMPAHPARQRIWGRENAKPAMPIFTLAGARSGWPMSCAIRKNIRMPSSPI